MSKTESRFTVHESPDHMKPCSFGSLAENHCENEAVWLDQNKSGWCETHKPTWRAHLERIGPDPEIPCPGRRYHTVGHPPANPSWCRSHFAR